MIVGLASIAGRSCEPGEKPGFSRESSPGRRGAAAVVPRRRLAFVELIVVFCNRRWRFLQGNYQLLSGKFCGWIAIGTPVAILARLTPCGCAAPMLEETGVFWPPGGWSEFTVHLLDGGSRVDRDVIRRSLREQFCSTRTGHDDSRLLHTWCGRRLSSCFYGRPRDAMERIGRCGCGNTRGQKLAAFLSPHSPPDSRLSASVAVPCPVDCSAHAVCLIHAH